MGHVLISFAFLVILMQVLFSLHFYFPIIIFHDEISAQSSMHTQKAKTRRMKKNVNAQNVTLIYFILISFHKSFRKPLILIGTKGSGIQPDIARYKIYFETILDFTTDIFG